MTPPTSDDDPSRREIWQFRKWRYKGILRHAWHQTFLIEYWRRIYMASRYLYFARVRGRVRTRAVDGSAVTTNTIPHNLKGLRDLSVARSDSLVKPLSVLECLDADARVLCVGPRAEGELYNLAAHGFDLANIRGVDLISYSPLIDLGDMHDLHYDDDSWDAVVCGWVLAYSDDKRRAARELVRVCKHGGVIAVGVEYNPRSRDAIAAELGYAPGSPERITTVAALLELFEGSVDRVYFSQEPTPARRDRLGSITAIFSVAKRRGA
jgi:SAM-dependent methyltransferase